MGFPVFHFSWVYLWYLVQFYNKTFLIYFQTMWLDVLSIEWGEFEVNWFDCVHWEIRACKVLSPILWISVANCMAEDGISILLSLVYIVVDINVCLTSFCRDRQSSGQFVSNQWQEKWSFGATWWIWASSDIVRKSLCTNQRLSRGKFLATFQDIFFAELE